MPLAAPPQARPASPRARRVLLTAGLVVVLIAAGAIVWSAFNPGGSGTSAHGCISVTLPSSMGGTLIHQCGSSARTTCHNAFAHADRLALLARPQCRLAGLAP